MTRDESLDSLIAKIESSLTSFEKNVSNMKCKLTELKEFQKEKQQLLLRLTHK